MDRLHWKLASPEERRAAEADAEKSLELFSSLSSEELLKDIEAMDRGETPPSFSKKL